MLRTVKAAFSLLLVLTALTGLAYPLAITAVAQTLFPRQANGSLVAGGEKIVGSALIGQRFVDSRYFHGRPSAAGPDGYDAAGSAGSNLGPTNPELLATVQKRAAEVVTANGPAAARPIPSDLVTASGSGLDPDISPAAAFLQVERVARARGLASGEVHSLVRRHVRDRQLGIFGEPRVNVLELNLALDGYK